MSRTQLWFLRINSVVYRGECVPLSAAGHPFLERDSNLGCGGDLIAVGEPELEVLLGEQKQVRKQGIIGMIHPTVQPDVCAALRRSLLLSPVQLRTILGELGCR